jgi:hypothetical protein
MEDDNPEKDDKGGGEGDKGGSGSGSGSGSGGGEAAKVCANTYPDMVLCDSLPGRYQFRSTTAALNALKSSENDKDLRITSPSPATSGPCPGVGMHYGVKSGGKYVASIVCCPCCKDTPAGPVKSNLCGIV